MVLFKSSAEPNGQLWISIKLIWLAQGGEKLKFCWIETNQSFILREQFKSSIRDDKECDAHGEENWLSICLDKTQKDVKIFKQSFLYSVHSLAPKQLLIYDIIRLI